MNTTAIDPIWIWIAAGVVVVLIVAALFARGARRSRSEALREKFGSEYDHAVETSGSRKRAEAELAARSEAASRYNIRPLTASDRDRYRKEWSKVEQHFLERPTAAVVEADELVSDMMRVQGYPMGDFERHAADLSVAHPQVVTHYRAGHKVIDGAPGSASTEDLRQAMLHYRALFDELLSDPGEMTEDRDHVAQTAPRPNEVTTAGRRDDVPRDMPPPANERDLSRRP